MKKQVIQVLWSIASGVGQKQNEKIVYPSIREQLSAIKTLMSIKGWEEELLVLQQTISVQQNSMDNQEILSVKTMDTTSVVNEKTESKEEFIAPSIEKETVFPLKKKDELSSTLKKGELSSTLKKDELPSTLKKCELSTILKKSELPTTLKKGELRFAPTVDDPIASLPACWRNAFGQKSGTPLIGREQLDFLLVQQKGEYMQYLPFVIRALATEFLRGHGMGAYKAQYFFGYGFNRGL